MQPATVLLVVLVAACGTSAPEPVSSPEPQPSTPPAAAGEPPEDSLTVPADPGGIHGTVQRRSDVSDIPDEVVEVGTVIVVPPERVEEFWRSAGYGAGGPPEIGRVEFDVDPGGLPAGAEAVTIGKGGTFTTSVLSGEVLLCLADDLEGDDVDPPHRVTGCAQVTAPDDGAVTLTTGFGGVMASAGDQT